MSEVVLDITQKVEFNEVFYQEILNVCDKHNMNIVAISKIEDNEIFTAFQFKPQAATDLTQVPNLEENAVKGT